MSNCYHKLQSSVSTSRIATQTMCICLRCNQNIQNVSLLLRFATNQFGQQKDYSSSTKKSQKDLICISTLEKNLHSPRNPVAIIQTLLKSIMTFYDADSIKIAKTNSITGVLVLEETKDVIFFEIW